MRFWWHSRDLVPIHSDVGRSSSLVDASADCNFHPLPIDACVGVCAGFFQRGFSIGLASFFLTEHVQASTTRPASHTNARLAPAHGQQGPGPAILRLADEERRIARFLAAGLPPPAPPVRPVRAARSLPRSKARNQAKRLPRPLPLPAMRCRRPTPPCRPRPGAPCPGPGLPQDADVAASKEQSAVLSTGLEVLPDTAQRASVNITSTSDLGSQLTFLYLYSTIEPNLQQISSVTPLLHHIFHAMRGK